MRLAPLFLALLATAALRAAPFERDLGRGLQLERIHTLPGDLPKNDPKAKPTACVLDVRYVTGDAEAANVLEAWVRFHASPRTPVFILANSATSPALLTALLAKPPAGVVTLGAAAPDFAPDIALTTTAEEERRAYDALEHDISLEALITTNATKPRNDEARLAKDHVPDGTPLPEADPVDANKTSAPIPPVDAVLARAVQLHRTLVALKKL